MNNFTIMILGKRKKKMKIMKQEKNKKIDELRFNSMKLLLVLRLKRDNLSETDFK